MSILLIAISSVGVPPTLYAVDRKFSGRFDIQTIFNEILVVH